MKLDELKRLKKLSSLSKVEAAPPSAFKSGEVTVTVEVREPNYLPDGVAVRARIDPVLFTADVPAEQLAALQADPKVKSVSVARPQRLIEPRSPNKS